MNYFIFYFRLLHLILKIRKILGVVKYFCMFQTAGLCKRMVVVCCKDVNSSLIRLTLETKWQFVLIHRFLLRLGEQVAG